MSEEIELVTGQVSTKELSNKKVYLEKQPAKSFFKKKKVEENDEDDDMKKYGKIRAFVFHPREKRCIGALIKRPDMLLMFHRADEFVPLQAMLVAEDYVQLELGSVTSGSAACKEMGISWDDCVMWQGMPVCYEDGEAIGFANDVFFDLSTGKVDHIVIDEGATAAALLGKRVVPSEYILGFKRGYGQALRHMKDSQDLEEGAEESEEITGALLVSLKAKEIALEGGLAKKAGELTGEVEHRAKEVVAAAKPLASQAAKATGKVVDKGAYATGKQLKRAKGMFGSFVDEYKKASK